MTVAISRRRALHRVNVSYRRRARRRSILFLPVALFLRLPFVVQFALVEALAVGIAALIGTVLGGAAAARDLGLHG